MNQCNIVQDLLPLYHDGVCSDESRAYVEAHLTSCAACTQYLKSLDEDATDEALKKETHDILKRHAFHEKTLAVKTGIILAAILMLPVLIMLLVTLSGSADWRTFAVLIASMLLVAGMTVVPLVAQTKKLSKTILFSTLALLLVIFFTEMFFDDGGWLFFGETACSVIFGLSLFLAPVVVYQARLPETMRNHKGLLTMCWDTLWLYLMLTMFAIAYPASASDLFGVSSFCAALAWLLFLTARYCRLPVWMKAGIMAALVGIWLSIGSAMGWITILPSAP